MTPTLTPQSTYDQLSYYALSLRDPEFIHQYIVDAFTAQTADENTKPITILFALVGLYLHLEKGFTGREVQLAHMQLGKVKQTWPTFTLPLSRGPTTVFDVLAAPAGPTRDRMIDTWSRSVWESWRTSHPQVQSWLAQNL